MRDVVAWAEAFWRLAGTWEPFPRRLESAVAWALPLAIVRLPRLDAANLLEWMSHRGICMKTRLNNRPIRGCLVARAGRGAVLLDGSDPDDEGRFSLAHEVAHFLIDYRAPREAALATLGPSVLEVLDGHRPATREERLAGIIRGVQVGVYTHLMERSTSGWALSADTIRREDRADRLAIELLAPHRVVTSQLNVEGFDWHEPKTFELVVSYLVEIFGLPLLAAERYGRTLVLSRQPASDFQRWLRGKGSLSNS